MKSRIDCASGGLFRETEDAGDQIAKAGRASIGEIKMRADSARTSDLLIMPFSQGMEFARWGGQRVRTTIFSLLLLLCQTHQTKALFHRGEIGKIKTLQFPASYPDQDVAAARLGTQLCQSGFECDAVWMGILVTKHDEAGFGIAVTANLAGKLLFEILFPLENDAT